MSTPRVTFPTAEGIGVFIGIVAWDLLTDGHMDLFKSMLITVPVTLAWFCLRCWKSRSARKRQ